jgi:MoaA/NifB/PqqE/SkfB family radical SAM enzyme
MHINQHRLQGLGLSKSTRKNDMSKVRIGNLELHVTHACNLQCESCSHFSNYGLKGHLSLEDADRQMGYWSHRIAPGLFSLLGGEPTLHPELPEFVELAARHWKESTIQLVTNGWFLHRHARLPDVLEKHGIRLEISVHHESKEYLAKVAKVRELVEDWQAGRQLRVHWRPSFKSWRRAYRGQGPSMEPYQDGNPATSWKNCPCRWCPQILNGNIYKCPPIAYLSMLNSKWELSESWRPYLGYQPLSPDCSDGELREFLSRKTESACGMCPARPERFLLPSPIPQVGGSTIPDPPPEPVPTASPVASIRVDVSEAESPFRPRDYDLSHWPTLPKVSCQCITYGRTHLLDEAVESFLRQDYAGEKELVILNDYPALRLECDLPNVLVVNLPRRMKSVGEKRNACVALCQGDIIFPWDDDDISLPHRISYSLEQMWNHRYFKPTKFWYWKHGEISPDAKNAVAHAMGCWSREFFDSVGGYAHLQSGQDMALENLFKGADRDVRDVPDEKLFYIYRFPGTGSYHLSTTGYGQGFEQVASFVKKQGIAGVHRIQPHWKQDYSRMVADLLAARNAQPIFNQPAHCS